MCCGPAASLLSPKGDPALIHLDGPPGAALKGPGQAVPPSESLI